MKQYRQAIYFGQIACKSETIESKKTELYIMMQKSERALQNIDDLESYNLMLQNIKVNSQVIVAESKGEFDKAVICYQYLINEFPENEDHHIKLCKTLEYSGDLSKLTFIIFFKKVSFRFCLFFVQIHIKGPFKLANCTRYLFKCMLEAW